MSDISIPGISGGGRFNTREMIDDLMKVERIPVTRMEERVERFQDQRVIWNDVSRATAELRDSARALYGFQSPFNSRIARSSNDAVLTAEATRQSQEMTSRIEVRQLAGRDHFLSRSLDRETDVEAGSYGFRVGEDEITFNFRGGSLREFSDAVNRNAGELVRSRVVDNTRDTSVITFEAQRTGAEQRLSFTDDAADFALSAGIIEPGRDAQRAVAISDQTLTRWTQPLDRQAVQVSEGTLTVRPGGELSLPVRPAFEVHGNVMLEFEVRVTDRSPEALEPAPPPPGPQVPEGPDASLQDITVEGARSRALLPDLEEPEPPQIVDDMRFLFAREGTASVPLPELRDTAEFQTVRIPLSDYVDQIDALGIRNRNSHRDLEIRNVRVFDPDARDDFEPLNAVEVASDSIILVDGVEIVRDSNTIDDVIAGTTLNLHQASTQPVSLAVEPDRETIKDSIIRFAGHYNQLIRDINILTRTNPAVIEEIGYFTDEEREQAQARLGALQGDSTLNQLRSRMQTLIMNPYETRAGSQLSLLAQIGVSTNVSGFSGSMDASRMRGYLEIDENQLDAAIRNDLQAVRDLFGYDTDGDFAVDSGVAYQVERNLNPYVQSGGVFAMRRQGLDARVERTESDIDTYNRRLDRREQQLRVEFGRMEGAMQMLEDNQQSLDALRPQQQR
ncbi:MAG: flagellar hook protein FliD [Spirochaetaceae bacterium]|nr:MAG: flagellar hook protein FliD [Spirochaetaceae bacterium]